MALIHGRAHDGVCPDARAGHTAIHLRTGIAVVAHAAVGRIRIAAHTRHRIACSGDVALIHGHACDRVCPDARTGLAAIHLRAGVVIAAHRAIGRFAVRGTRTGHTRARFRDVAGAIGCATNRTGCFECARGRTAIAVHRIAVVASFIAFFHAVAAGRCNASMRNLRGEGLVGQTGESNVVDEPTARALSFIRTKAEANANGLVRDAHAEVDVAILHRTGGETRRRTRVGVAVGERIAGLVGDHAVIPGYCAQRADVGPGHAVVLRVFNDAAVPSRTARQFEVVTVLERHAEARGTDDEIRRFIRVIADAGNVLAPSCFIDADRRGHCRACNAPEGRSGTRREFGSPGLGAFPRFRRHGRGGTRSRHVIHDFARSRGIDRGRTSVGRIDDHVERNIRRVHNGRRHGDRNRDRGRRKRYGCGNRRAGPARELDIGIARRHGHRAAGQVRPTRVLHFNRDRAAFTRVDDTVIIARRRGFRQCERHEGRIGTIGHVVFHDAREVRRRALRTNRTRSGAARREARHQVLHVLKVSSGISSREDRIALFGNRRIERRDLHAGDEVIEHFAFGLGKRMPRHCDDGIFEKVAITFPQHRAPDFAGVVHFGIRNTTKPRRSARRQALTIANMFERQTVLRHIRRVRISANAVITAVTECRRRIHARGKCSGKVVIAVHELQERLEIAPAFAHRAILLVSTGRQTHVQVMAPFVPDDTVVNRAVAIDRAAGLRRAERVHLHDRRRTVRRRLHIGIVRAAVVLRFGMDRIIADAAATVVVHLRIAGRFIKARIVPEVVVVVVVEEQLRNRRPALRYVRIGLLRRIVRPVKRAGSARRRAEVATRQTVGCSKIDVRIDVVAVRTRRTRCEPRIERTHRVRIESVDRHGIRRDEHRRRTIRHTRRMRRKVRLRTIGRRIRRRAFAPNAILERRFFGQTRPLEHSAVVRRNHISVEHRRRRTVTRRKLDVIRRNQLIGHRVIHLLDTRGTGQTNLLRRRFRGLAHREKRIPVLRLIHVRKYRCRHLRHEIVVERCRNRIRRRQIERRNALRRRRRMRMQIAADRHELHLLIHEHAQRRMMHIEPIGLLLENHDDSTATRVVHLGHVRRIERALIQPVQRRVMFQVKLRRTFRTRHERPRRYHSIRWRHIHRGHTTLLVDAPNPRQHLPRRRSTRYRTRNGLRIAVRVVIREFLQFGMSHRPCQQGRQHRSILY